MKNLLILGATSAMAQEAARQAAAPDMSFFLAGRNTERLTAIADDLRVRGAGRVDTFALDLDDCARHDELLDRAWACLGTVDGALVAHGCLGEQQKCERDWATAEQVLRTNFLGQVSLLGRLANRFEAQGKGGVIAAITSVAGDRGRQSNYVYGCAKGGVSLFLQGLRNRLHPHGVAVTTIKPGFVDTPMTATYKKGPLWASAATAGRGILAAMRKRKDVAYVPGFWWAIMAVIRSIPECVFKRMRL